MSIPVSQCTVFIQIWVDTNAVKTGQSTGIYMVDNRTAKGSTGEGSSSLQTMCTNNSFICWTVIPIDPNFITEGGQIVFQSIGNSNAWGYSGQPQKINVNQYTGQAQNEGTASYPLGLIIQLPEQSEISALLNPGIIVN